MVRIDGSLVRRLREEKGLTQLYLATAVGVTTDTISRWENRHYQSVKLDNAQRLAAALEVDLAEILEAGSDAGSLAEPGAVPPATEDVPARARRSALVPVLVGLLVLAALTGAFFFFRSPLAPAPEISLAASRKMPGHAMPGLPFPVVIVVEAQGGPLSVVVKEVLPANIRVTSSSAALQPVDKAELKWIVRHMAGSRRFGYMVTATGEGALHFQGSVHTRAGQEKEVAIGGRQSLAMAPFHWADSNQDGIISDEEILVVYDDFEDVDGLAVDVGLVDDIWMGSGYRWDQQNGTFVIIP